MSIRRSIAGSRLPNAWGQARLASWIQRTRASPTTRTEAITATITIQQHRQVSATQRRLTLGPTLQDHPSSSIAALATLIAQVT